MIAEIPILKDFEVVRDAPRLGCRKCKSTAIDIARLTAKTGFEGQLAAICVPCGICEPITKEDWNKIFI